MGRTQVLNIPCDIPVDESVQEELQAGKDLENINVEVPTREEVRRNLKRIQNDKAPGVYGKTAKMWKADIELSVTELHGNLTILRQINLQGCLPPTNSKQITWKYPHWQTNDSSRWKTKPLAVLLKKEFGKYFEVTVFQKRLYALLRTGTTTVEVKSSMKEASHLHLHFIQSVKSFDITPTIKWQNQ